jgi:hypothetical protein
VQRVMEEKLRGMTLEDLEKDMEGCIEEEK